MTAMAVLIWIRFGALAPPGAVDFGRRQTPVSARAGQRGRASTACVPLHMPAAKLGKAARRVALGQGSLAGAQLAAGARPRALCLAVTGGVHSWHHGHHGQYR